MGTRVDQFIAGLPVRDVDMVQPLTEINGQAPPASYTSRENTRRFFFTPRRPETARVGLGQEEDPREAVRKRIAERRRRFAREHETALSQSGANTGERTQRARRAMALRQREDEHTVRALRPTGLAPEYRVKLDVPGQNYDAPPVAPPRDGKVLDISG